MNSIELRSMGHHLVKQADWADTIQKGISTLGKSQILSRAGAAADKFLTTSSPLKTSLVTAGAGAALNVGREALRKDDPQRPKNYLGAAVSGGLRGATIGGLAHGAYGNVRMARAQLPSGVTGADAIRGTVNELGNSAKDKIQQGWHALTGEGDIRQTSFANPDAVAKRYGNLANYDTNRMRARYGDDAAQKAFDLTAGRAGPAVAQANMQKTVLDSGLTNLPAIARGAYNDPTGTAQKAWGNYKAMHGGSTGSALLSLGAPVVGSYLLGGAGSVPMAAFGSALSGLTSMLPQGGVIRNPTSIVNNLVTGG